MSDLLSRLASVGGDGDCNPGAGGPGVILIDGGYRKAALTVTGTILGDWATELYC